MLKPRQEMERNQTMVKRYRPDVEEEQAKEKLPAKMTLTPRWTARAAREWAYTTGELPHMFLLRVARGEEVKEGGKKPSFEERVDAAKACAAFFAPKLQTVAVTDREERDPPQELIFNEEVLESLSDAELTLFEKLFSKLIGRANAGEGKDPATKKKTENRYTRTLDLKAE